MNVKLSGLISLINDSIGTVQKLTCISRPRRFGKSFAAKMLCAYYDKTKEIWYLHWVYGGGFSKTSLFHSNFSFLS